MNELIRTVLVEQPLAKPVGLVMLGWIWYLDFSYFSLAKHWTELDCFKNMIGVMTVWGCLAKCKFS